MKDNDTLLGIAILIALIIIMIITPKSASNTSGPDGEKTSKSNSSQTRDLSLGTGNASYVYQPYEEYITIDNRERSPVNITNWKLKNGKDKRAYDIGGTLKYYPADTATIGQATLVLSPTGANVFQHVVLEDGETAVITTGSMGPQLPYKIVSFKENICTGYLEDLSEYTFTPPLTRNCPRPSKEIEEIILDTECRKFVESMSSCHTPKFDTRDSEGNICNNCVDEKPLSSSCVAFIRSHFNYSSCVANHKNDADFSGRTWRIFLGKGWEMWAKEYETIKLFDQLGRLVDSESY